MTIDDLAVELLKRHRTAMRARALAVGGRLGKNPWVFSDDPLCREPLAPGRLTSAWKRAATKAGHTGVRLQDARRWAGTALLDEGEDITVVADLFGHADPATTRRHYVRSTVAGGRRSAAIRGRILGDPNADAR